MLKKITAALALTLATTAPAFAVATLTIDDGTNSITVMDGDANDSNPIDGIVTIIWTAPDTLWTSTVSTGTTYPADGSPSLPYLDLNVVATSGGAGMLTITFTMDGFTLADGSFASNVGGTLNSSGTMPQGEFSAEAGGQAISSLGPFDRGAFAGSMVSMFSGLSTPYSITLQAVITHASAGTSSFDYEVTVPEPGTLALLGLGLFGLGIAGMRRARG
jgi:hypothetical protein